MVLAKDASFSALLHELQHHKDNKEAGYLGMRGLFDLEFRRLTESNAYGKEIELMEKNGFLGVADKLRKNLQTELDRIDKILKLTITE